MKVTFVLGTLNLSGGVRIVAEHARMLHERGHEVTVASSVRRRPRVRDRVRAWVKGRPIARRPEGSHLDGAAYRVITTDRPRAVRADDLPDADLILATWWETAEWVAGLSKSKGAKAYFIQHHEIHDGQPKERVAATWRLPPERPRVDAAGGTGSCPNRQAAGHLIGGAWRAHAAGDRGGAIRLAAGAVRLDPAGLAGWRTLALVAVRGAKRGDGR